ncbi:MAG: MnhB domain-containing protein [Acidimicrobiales bacterium]
MTRSTVMDTTARLIFHSALVLSVYLLLAGHNQPGGGFVGGLVAGAAVAVHYVAGGIDDVRAVTRVGPWLVLASGLLLASGAALVPLVAAGAVLAGGSIEIALPVLGEAKLTSALAFDTGVYLIVVGLVCLVFEAFGEEPVVGPGPR